MWIDARGNYQGFRRTRTDYQAYGPCLTDVRYQEETAHGEIVSSVRTSIARSDDYLRTFYHLRYDVRQTVNWKRLAFFQLGGDYYNETPSRQAAIGNANGLTEEWNWPAATEETQRVGKPLSGREPWISIHSVDRTKVGKGGAAASRGLIVRSWKAVLDGKKYSEPSASFHVTKAGTKRCAAAEVIPPPDVQTLKAGDFIEADLELTVFPADASAYYGPNRGFRQILENEGDTWRLVDREATGNHIEAVVKTGSLSRVFPLELAVDRAQHASCMIKGGVGYVPITFTGLKDYRGFELLVDGRALNQAVHGNDFWQTDYDPQSSKWRITYNIPRDQQGSSRLELRRITDY